MTASDRIAKTDEFLTEIAYLDFDRNNSHDSEIYDVFFEGDNVSLASWLEQELTDFGCCLFKVTDDGVRFTLDH